MVSLVGLVLEYSRPRAIVRMSINALKELHYLSVGRKGTRDGLLCRAGRWGLYWAVEVASIEEADGEVAGAGMAAGSTMTVRVEVEVRQVVSVAT
jgi:hypothetical protein